MPCPFRTNVLICSQSWKLNCSGTYCPRNFPTRIRVVSSFLPVLSVPSLIALRKSPGGKERFLKRRRAQRMLELKQEGKSLKEIARIFEVSPRTVRRWLKAVGHQESKVKNQNDKSKCKKVQCEALASRG